MLLHSLVRPYPAAPFARSTTQVRTRAATKPPVPSPRRKARARPTFTPSEAKPEKNRRTVGERRCTATPPACFAMPTFRSRNSHGRQGPWSRRTSPPEEERIAPKARTTIRWTCAVRAPFVPSSRPNTSVKLRSGARVNSGPARAFGGAYRVHHGAAESFVSFNALFDRAIRPLAVGSPLRMLPQQAGHPFRATPFRAGRSRTASGLLGPTPPDMRSHRASGRR